MSAQIPDLHAPGLGSYITPGFGVIECRLLNTVSSSHDLTDELICHLAVAGGKRTHPLFTLVCAQLGEPEHGLNEQVITAATVVELTHLASLYHDDVMDSAPARHGVPPVQRLWGNNYAVLAGDILFARASLLVIPLDPEMVAYHARMFERLYEGQLSKTSSPAGGANRVDFYLQVLVDKTGSLVSTAASFSALLLDVGQLMADMVSDFDEKVGVAFQITDNVFGLASSDKQSGKTPGIDLREGVDTLPALLLRHHEAAGTIDEADVHILHELTGDPPSDEALASVVEQLRSHDVPEETRGLARTWASNVVAALASLPKGETKIALGAFVNLIADRLV